MPFFKCWADGLLHWFYICIFIDLMFCNLSTYFDAYSSLTWKTCCHSCGGPAAGADRYWHPPWEWGGCRGSYRCSGEYIRGCSSILSCIIYGISVCIATFSWALIYNINSQHPKKQSYVNQYYSDFAETYFYCVSSTSILEFNGIHLYLRDK